MHDRTPDAGRPRTDRAGLARRAARPAARAPAVVAAPRLRQRAALPAGLRRRRRAPRRLHRARRPGPLPVHGEGRPARQLPVRDVRRAARPGRRACTPQRAPPAGRPWSATPPTTSPPGRSVMARSIRAGGGRPGDMIHVAYGYGLFTGGLGAHYGAEALGCTVIPVSGGMTERQVTLIRDFEPDVIMVTPSATCSPSSTRWSGRASTRAARRCRSASSAPSRGPTTCAPRWRRRLDIHAVDIYGLSEVMGPGVAHGVRRDQGRPARLGGPLLPRGHRPADRRGAARRRARASWSSPR